MFWTFIFLYFIQQFYFQVRTKLQMQPLPEMLNNHNKSNNNHHFSPLIWWFSAGGNENLLSFEACKEDIHRLCNKVTFFPNLFIHLLFLKEGVDLKSDMSILECLQDAGQSESETLTKQCESLVWDFKVCCVFVKSWIVFSLFFTFYNCKYMIDFISSKLAHIYSYHIFYFFVKFHFYVLFSGKIDSRWSILGCC